MSTEYYLLIENPEYAESPLTEPKFNKKVIGVSAFGWQFGLHTYYMELNSISDWIKRIQDTNSNGEYIIDEYHRYIEPQQMIDIITKREEYTVPFNLDKLYPELTIETAKNEFELEDNKHYRSFYLKIPNGTKVLRCVIDSFAGSNTVLRSINDSFPHFYYIKSN